MNKLTDFGGPPHPPAPKVDISQATDIVCKTDECGGKLFLPAARFKKVSKILTGAPQDMLLPIDVYVCAKCGATLEELLPRGLDD